MAVHGTSPDRELQRLRDYVHTETIALAEKVDKLQADLASAEARLAWLERTVSGFLPPQ